MSSSGSFLAILLSVPLTAVALVGVIGVPQLKELVSSSSSAEEEDLDQGSFGGRSRSRRGGSKTDRVEEDAAPWSTAEFDDSDFGNDAAEGKPRSTRSKGLMARNNRSRTDDAEDLDAQDSFTANDSFGSAPRSGRNPREPENVDLVNANNPFGQKPAVNQANLTMTSQNDTGVMAAGGARRTASGAAGTGLVAVIEELRRSGVERYHLEPGLDAGHFLFVCQIDAVGQPGTIHRFEAEAPDPTVAAQDVLQQITDWKARNGSASRTAGLEMRR